MFVKFISCVKYNEGDKAQQDLSSSQMTTFCLGSPFGKNAKGLQSLTQWIAALAVVNRSSLNVLPFGGGFVHCHLLWRTLLPYVLRLFFGLVQS